MVTDAELCEVQLLHVAIIELPQLPHPANTLVHFISSERERERERERGGGGGRERKTERERNRRTDRQTVRHTDR